MYDTLLKILMAAGLILVRNCSECRTCDFVSSAPVIMQETRYACLFILLILRGIPMKPSVRLKVAIPPPLVCTLSCQSVTAMGTRMAPSYANLFIAELENIQLTYLDHSSASHLVAIYWMTSSPSGNSVKQHWQNS